MAKHVFGSHEQVAHIWANVDWFGDNPTPDHGRASDKRLYYEANRTIFSYGSHFPIARFHNSRKGPYVLFTTDSYSLSTRRHMSYVQRAIPSRVPVFHVGEIPTYGPDNSKSTWANYKRRLNSLVEHAARTRGRKALRFIDQAAYLVDEANRYAAWVGKPWRLKMPKEASPEKLKELRAKLKAQKARADEKTRKAQAEARAEWMAGNLHTSMRGFTLPDGSAALRVIERSEGKVLQTSLGAEVPFAHALRAFKFIKLCRDRAQSWAPNGHSLAVGHFRVDFISPEGNIKAGCHQIQWAEIERIARQESVFDLPASQEALKENPSHVD